MPFDPSFKDLYELGIKSACSDAGAYCERVDEQIYDESILQRVYNQIAKADLIVAEMTGRNPNVFYEVGYAHALGKRVILLTEKVEDIPFDLQHYPHIVHGKRIVDLKPELSKRVRWCIENPQGRSQMLSPTLECFVNKIPIVGNPLVEEDSAQNLEVNITNSVSRAIETVDFQVGLFVPKALLMLGCYHDRRGTDQIMFQGFHDAADRSLNLMQEGFQLLPGAWIKFFVLLTRNKGSSPSEHAFVIRIFTPSGFLDFPFRLQHPGVLRVPRPPAQPSPGPAPQP